MCQECSIVACSLEGDQTQSAGLAGCCKRKTVIIHRAATSDTIMYWGIDNVTGWKYDLRVKTLARELWQKVKSL